jgi:mitochondrial fission protein ELM1
LPRQKLAQVKRLGQVVVGPRIQQRHYRLFIVASGHHQNRRALARLPDTAQQLHSIHLRQHQIKQHNIVFAGLRQKKSLLTIVGNIHRVPRALAQTASNIFRQSRFVFDD